ncbi:MAG: hypothetical protein Q7U31_01165, partial [Anaerolineaceae bacterium]|nr:hypothetical protein [Anaerolineaceae bacterium]
MLDSLKIIFFRVQNRINLILIFLLVAVIAFFAWQLENRVYAIFILSFYIVALFFKQRLHFELIIVPIILFFIFNTLTLEALLLLKK